MHGVLGACDFGLFNLLSKPFGHRGIHSVGCAWLCTWGITIGLSM